MLSFQSPLPSSLRCQPLPSIHAVAAEVVKRLVLTTSAARPGYEMKRDIERDRQSKSKSKCREQRVERTNTQWRDKKRARGRKTERERERERKRER